MLNESLNGKWKVSYVPHQSEIDEILSPRFVPEGWLDAVIPEEIHSTLRKAGLIRGHFYGKDIEEERWIEEVDWVYYKEFYIGKEYKKQRVVIEFEGLDTFCDIYLNGIKIGSGKNMFTGITLDVTNKLKYGHRNILVVRFYSPIEFVKGLDYNDLFSTTTVDRIKARKAQMNYGWDFCGRCVTIGIWKSVTIKAYDHNYIETYYLYTSSIGGDYATVGLEVNVLETVESLEGYTLAVQLSLDGNTIYQFEGSVNEFQKLMIEIQNPALWWPRPYGKQVLYDFKLVLQKGEDVVDTKTQKFGIRTVEIIQEDQGDGRSFIFSVNGKRLFVRGANWVPINVVYTEIRDEEYEEYISYAVEGNLSMLRVWGGGIYESDKFFQLCDEKGIMVWQDFMFACGVYPQTEDFLVTVYDEAVYNLKKYRNYTSLVLWCGDNENDEAYGWDMRPYGFLQDKVNREVLKSAWERYDPHRCFIPSSPFSPFEFYKGGDNPKSPHQGDMHIYLTSADPKARNYYKKIKTYRPRFMSEFGFISFPERDTYYRFNFLKEKHTTDASFRFPVPYIEKQIQAGESEAFIYASQVYNSHGLKYWIEYFRSLKWTCAGALYWKFNDPIADARKGGLFPTLMATVDMYKMPKMTYYYARRAFEDVILVCDEVKGGYHVYSCSEIEQDLPGELIISHLDFDGNLLGMKTRECTIKKDSATLLDKVNIEEFATRDRYREYIKVEFIAEERTLENRYFLVDMCEFDRLKFKPAGLKVVNVIRDDDELRITLKTDKYARNVRMNILDQRATYEDNYFDMDPGSERILSIRLHNKDNIRDKALYVEGENVQRIVVPLANV